MFEKFAQLFTDKPGDRATEIEDPLLGKLILSEDEDWWEGSVKIGEKKVCFLLGGDLEPGRELIAHAHDIVQIFDRFESMIADFLLDEALRWKSFSDEIRRLVVEDICLVWPDRPDDGMIYFKGPDEYRVWRCDYVNRRPTKLGFDD